MSPLRLLPLLRITRVVAFSCVVSLAFASRATGAEHSWQPPGTVEITERVVTFMQSAPASDKDHLTYGNAILGAFSSLEKAENVAIERAQALVGLLGKVLTESDQLSLEQMRRLQEACERVADAQENAAQAYERFPAAATAAVHAADFSDSDTARQALETLLAECRLSFAAAWHRADAAMHRRMAHMLEEARNSVAPDLVISQLSRPRIEANVHKKRLEAAFKRGDPVAP